MRAFHLLPLCLLTCAHDVERRYAGLVQPVSGTCDPASRAILTVRSGVVQFTPGYGVLTLTGSQSASGEIAAALDRTGADRKPYRLALAGSMQEAAFRGTFVTPRCQYTVSLVAEQN